MHQNNTQKQCTTTPFYLNDHQHNLTNKKLSTKCSSKTMNKTGLYLERNQPHQNFSSVAYFITTSILEDKRNKEKEKKKKVKKRKKRNKLHFTLNSNSSSILRLCQCRPQSSKAITQEYTLRPLPHNPYVFWGHVILA